MLFLNIYYNYYRRFSFVRDVCTVIDVTNDAVNVEVSKLLNRFSL